MGLNHQEKVTIVGEFSAVVAKAQSVVIAEHRGMNVASINALRKKARESGVYLRVLKNSLARRAMNNTAFGLLCPELVGPLIYSISEDPIEAAKVMASFAKHNEGITIKAGALPNHLIAADSVIELASLPPRAVLLSRLLGTIQLPIARFLFTLNEVPTSFARVLEATCNYKRNHEN